MNMKVVLLVALTLVILGVPASFARPEYVSSLSAEYGVSSCGTCHIDSNGGGERNAYGISFQNQPNHRANPGAALKAIGAPPNANPTVIATATFTPIATATPASPGFGIVLSLVGLFAWSLLARRNNK